MGTPPLVCHTFYREFSGLSPEEVIRHVYEDCREGTGCTFSEWWEYQKTLWGTKYGHVIPDSPDSDNAYHTLLDVLIKVGALEAGPQPPTSRT
jgi:hypothetical protein